MKASEAKIKAVWNSIPSSIRLNILNAVENGNLYTYSYKSVKPEVFNDIDTTIIKLQLLGYKAECDTVEIVDSLSSPSSITTDTKLTITW